MVDFRTVGQAFRSTLTFRTLVLGTLSLNFLLVGYNFLTSEFGYELPLLEGVFVYLFTGFFIYFILFGPLILVAFFVHLSRASEPVAWWALSSIPEGSTLYDAIMLPTVHCGPIKVILPVVPEDAVLEAIDDESLSDVPLELM